MCRERGNEKRSVNTIELYEVAVGPLVPIEPVVVLDGVPEVEEIRVNVVKERVIVKKNCCM